MIDILLKVLGLANGASTANKALGLLNYAALAPLGIWAWVHRDDLVTFTVSLGTIGIIAVLALFVLELQRRTPTSKGDTPSQ